VPTVTGSERGASTFRAHSSASAATAAATKAALGGGGAADAPRVAASAASAASDRSPARLLPAVGPPVGSTRSAVRRVLEARPATRAGAPTPSNTRDSAQLPTSVTLRDPRLNSMPLLLSYERSTELEP